MAVCDICGKAGTGQFVTSDNMRRAVCDRGFDPFKLGLAEGGAMGALGLSISQLFENWKNMMFENWKNMMVMPETGGWNVCPQCMAVLGRYLNVSSGSTSAASYRQSVAGSPQTAPTAPVQARVSAPEAKPKLVSWPCPSPACGQLLNAPEDAAGRGGKCPKCGGRIVVPSKGDGTFQQRGTDNRRAGAEEAARKIAAEKERQAQEQAAQRAREASAGRRKQVQAFYKAAYDKAFDDGLKNAIYGAPRRTGDIYADAFTAVFANHDNNQRAAEQTARRKTMTEFHLSEAELDSLLVG